MNCEDCRFLLDHEDICGKTGESLDGYLVIKGCSEGLPNYTLIDAQLAAMRETLLYVVDRNINTPMTVRASKALEDDAGHALLERLHEAEKVKPISVAELEAAGEDYGICRRAGCPHLHDDECFQYGCGAGYLYKYFSELGLIR